MPDVKSESSPPGAAATSSAAGGPLLPEHFEEVALAQKRAASLARALRIASFNGWTLALAAVVTLVIGMLDVESIILGSLLAALAFNELRGLRLLRAFRMEAPGVLGWNQVALMLLLVGYAIWKLATLDSSANPYAKEMAAYPELKSMLGPIAEMTASLTRSVYWILMAVGVIYQGGNALYYFSRRKHLQAYLDQTPDWVVQLERTRRRG